MKKLLLVLFAAISVILVSSAPLVFAQMTYAIKIPTGAASPDAPYFWQNTKDGSTTGDITIQVLDTVVWQNADTAAHTVTSGNPEDGPDGIFDSGLFSPGKSFSYQFTEVGTYDYFCLVHPWMVGTVTVTSGLEKIPNVGADAGDGQTTFDVEYEFNRIISSASVNEDQKSITFEIIGKPKSDDNTLTMMLPKNLIGDPYVIWVDGKQRMDYDVHTEGGMNTLVIELDEKSELVTIVGPSVVPEFGTIAAGILVIAIIGTIIISSRVGIRTPRPNFLKIK